jgi:hypothetical protein
MFALEKLRRIPINGFRRKCKTKEGSTDLQSRSMKNMVREHLELIPRTKVENELLPTLKWPESMELR